MEKIKKFKLFDNIYEGWLPVKKEIIQIANENIHQAEHYNSFINQQYNKMMYREIEGEIVVIKPVPLMGYYNIIRYCGGYSGKDFSCNGITMRGSDVIGGNPDNFGSEFVYDSEEFLEMKGKKFEKIRNICRKINEFNYVVGFNSDIEKVINLWSESSGSKHQIKQFKFVKENKELCSFVTVYYKKEIVGFSITEKINKNNGIILQQLINPSIKNKIPEPNFILHYFNCLENRRIKLNIGSAVGIKNMEIAKRKLQPCVMIPIFRKVSTIKLTKEIYNKICQK